MHDHSSAGAGIGNCNQHTFDFNAVEKIIELYDALLKSEREKVELLERMLRVQNTQE